MKLVLRPLGTEALKQIRAQPGIGSSKQVAISRLAGLRSWPVPGFEDIRIYYLRPDEKTVRVIRILHGKRDVVKILRREEG